MDAIQSFIQAANDKAVKEAQKEQEKETQALLLRDQVDAARQRIIGEALEKMGVDGDIVDGETVKVGRFKLGIAWMSLPGSLYPMEKKRDGTLIEVSNPRYKIIVKLTGIDPQYLKGRPNNGVPYIDSSKWINLSFSHNDGENVFFRLKAEIGEAMQYLLAEERAAPERKAEIDAAHEELEAARKEREREQKEERQRLEAERQAARAAWAAKEKAREEKEAALRAEVAEKFGVSADAFEYLIEHLADELRRRNACEEGWS